ncbi:ABC transporter ATP-binding protein [Subtercola endophyticus]|uniref:ABC transporter ATP-binding protein n=1 Tax=Subtercola endophyticus TaxID=2895559 RepID=UPI001E324642|nr:ABC transporter ATP-binding protein [Subtercola endophyticus]UFS57547.1 ABC transporter ATP-binding protein [Subtercola endophyticus]
MTGESAAVELRGVSKQYGRVSTGHLALDTIDLTVEAGSVFGMIGPNGAGKTTTMRLLLDIIRPTAGSIRVLGSDPMSGGAELRRRVGYLPGELRLEGRVTGRSLLQHYARISGPVSPGAIDALAERLGVQLDRPVRMLSKGNKQKLGLVQAFMHHPPLLVLDEPTSGLDPLVQREFLAMVREAREAGQTIFLSSHVLSEIQQVADAVAIVRSGRIVTVSSVEGLRETAVRRVRAGFADTTPGAVGEMLAGIRNLSDLVVTSASGITVPAGGAAAGSTVGSGVTEVREVTEVTEVTATVSGDIDPFVKAIARFAIVDLAIEEPDLEESVLKLYGAAGER